MHKLQIGELYVSTRSNWPESVEYNFAGNEHELRFFLKSPTSREINSVRRDPVQIGLFVQDDMIFILYRFRDMRKNTYTLDGDAPYSIHLVPEDVRTMPIIPENTETRVLLHIRLIDADTGILKVMRGVSLEHSLSVALCSAIHEQAAQQFDRTAHERRIQEIYSRYRDTDSMFRHAIASCYGGE